MTNLADNLIRSALRHPTRPAVRLDETVLSYGDLNDLACRAAGWLVERGVQPGDRVGLMLPNVLAFPVLYYGILRAGGIVVPMNPLLKAREVEHCLGDSGARLAWVCPTAADEASRGAGLAEIVTAGETFLSDAASWPSLREVGDRDGHDTAAILYTSGTTGRPKGAELTHANLSMNAAITARDVYGLTREDVVMGCLPLFHAFGQTCAMNTAVSVGASLTLVPRFDPELVLRVIERDRVTVFEGVPTMYVALTSVGAVADTASLRLCVGGGAPLPEEVLQNFADTFGAQILEGYGLSETAPVASSNHRGRARAGSIGHPIPGVQMRVVDETGATVPAGEVGEIVIRGHNVMKGYWNQPDATAEAIKAGWFHSGDMARQDADGFFFIVGRKKDIIIRGGFNVYPREIEEVLYENPSVLEAAVIGIGHPSHGEEIAAAVVLKPGATATADGLREYVKARVAAYKYPRHVWLYDSLPKGPTGKILKREIQARTLAI